MDISPQTLSKLLLIGQYQLPSEYFAIFLQKIYDDLSNCFSYIIPESLNIPQYMDYESCVLNEAYSTILIFIIEALKNSIGEEALKSNLEDCLWPQNMIDTFIHFYSVNQVTQLKTLQHIQSAFPKLLDVNWKLDYYVKNKDLEHVCDLCFRISLSTENIGKSEIESLSFSCDFEELQDLVGKFRDAVKSIERLSQI